MGLLDSIFGSRKNTRADKIVIEIAEKGRIMFDNNEVSNEALFEVLIFSSLRIINTYKEQRPKQYESFLDGYYQALENWAKSKGIYNKISGSFSQFVHNRFQLFVREMQFAYDDPMTLRAKTAYHFYEKPLAIASENSMNIEQIVKMAIRTNELSKIIDSLMERELALN